MTDINDGNSTLIIRYEAIVEFQLNAVSLLFFYKQLCLINILFLGVGFSSNKKFGKEIIIIFFFSLLVCYVAKVFKTN